MDATDAGTARRKCRTREDDPDEERAIHPDEMLAIAKVEGLCPEK